MSRSEEIVVGLDVGTTKICTIIGEVNADGMVDVIGVGTASSRGLRRGVVINIDQTVASIRKAVSDAELMAGCQVESVFAGISGGHIKGINSHGVIAIKNKEVTTVEVARVIDAAKAVAIPLDREVIHILPQEFMVDTQDGIKEPVGMAGVRLEAKVHIITGAVSAAQNIVRCAHRSGLRVHDLVLQQMASAEAVLSPDERELGVALVDIGGGTTDVAVFAEGSIQHTCVIPVGGDQLTNDIAVGLRTPMAEAEKIKAQLSKQFAQSKQPTQTPTATPSDAEQRKIETQERLRQKHEQQEQEKLKQEQEEQAKQGTAKTKRKNAARKSPSGAGKRGRQFNISIFQSR
jgi:cell division protein FtsA